MKFIPPNTKNHINQLCDQSFSFSKFIVDFSFDLYFRFIYSKVIDTTMWFYELK